MLKQIKSRSLNGQILSIFAVLTLIFVIRFIIYFTGGTSIVYTHMMYIPIIISAFIFDIRGSLATSFFAGVAIHNLGMEVIAEGAETAVQTEILKDMNCDHIQGYYFSKPLPPDEAKSYILNFGQPDRIQA